MLSTFSATGFGFMLATSKPPEYAGIAYGGPLDKQSLCARVPSYVVSEALPLVLSVAPIGAPVPRNGSYHFVDGWWIWQGWK